VTQRSLRREGYQWLARGCKEKRYFEEGWGQPWEREAISQIGLTESLGEEYKISRKRSGMPGIPWVGDSYRRGLGSLFLGSGGKGMEVTQGMRKVTHYESNAERNDDEILAALVAYVGACYLAPGRKRI